MIHIWKITNLYYSISTVPDLWYVIYLSDTKLQRNPMLNHHEQAYVKNHREHITNWDYEQSDKS